MVDFTPVVLGLAAVVPLVGLSAFFSSSETAIFSLPTDTTDEPRAGDRDEVALADLRADPHRLLVTLLVGNNLVNIAISSIVTVVVSGFVSAGTAVAVTTIVASGLILIFGEIVPKSYGLGHARTWALRVARPLTYVERLLGPLVWLFDGLTRRLSVRLGGDPDVEEQYLDE